VLGGKIIGAGGGFLMLYCPGEHKRLERFMQSEGMPRLHYTLEPEGSTVVASLAGNFVASNRTVAAPSHGAATRRRLRPRRV